MANKKAQREITIKICCLFNDNIGVDQESTLVVNENQGLPFAVTSLCCRAQKLLPSLRFEKGYLRVLLQLCFEYLHSLRATDLEHVLSLLKENDEISKQLEKSKVLGSLKDVVETMFFLRLSEKSLAEFEALDVHEKATVYSAAMMWFMLDNNIQISQSSVNNIHLKDVFDDERFWRSFESMMAVGRVILEITQPKIKNREKR